MVTTLTGKEEGVLICNKVRGIADCPEDLVLHFMLVFPFLAWNHNLESNILSVLNIVGHPDGREAAPAKLVLDAISPGQHFSYPHRVVQALFISFKGLTVVHNVAFLSESTYSP